MLDRVAIVTLPGEDKRSMTGRPSGVFSTTPAQLRGERQAVAEAPDQRPRLRPLGEDERVAAEGAVVLRRPGMGLDRALGVGVAAEAVADAAHDVVARERHEVARPPAVRRSHA